MRPALVAAVVLVLSAGPVAAVEFLGVELCAEQIDTGIILPAESPLSLESVEAGKHGSLVLLLSGDKNAVLGQVDDLMASVGGSRGTGDERKLEWTSDEITAFAQVLRQGYVALAVRATVDCTVEPEPVAAAEAEESQVAPPAEGEEETAQTVETAATSAVTEPADGAEGESAAEPPAPAADFELVGRLKNAAAEDGWADVMGVVVNKSGIAYTVASFDLSLYDDAGDLICVDTISINHLREGQRRAFRGAIRCADYEADEVASWKLQFAGGHEQGTLY